MHHAVNYPKSIKSGFLWLCVCHTGKGYSKDCAETLVGVRVQVSCLSWYVLNHMCYITTGVPLHQSSQQWNTPHTAVARFVHSQLDILLEQLTFLHASFVRTVYS